MSENQIPQRVVRFFIESRDYNGLPLRTLLLDDEASRSELLSEVENAVEGGLLTLEFGSVVMNPHIRSPVQMPPEEQIRQLKADGPDDVCLYPTAALVREHGDVEGLGDRPYSQRLFLVEPQLRPVFFDLTVLDRYQSDPRYDFYFEDFGGSISISDKYYQSDSLPDRDEVLLQSFGVGYDERMNRVVVVFLRYLGSLSPEHQRIWQAQERADDCKMSESYYQTAIRGEWIDYGSIYRAFLEEQVVVNRMAEAMGRGPFFRQTYTDVRPREFSAFILPTLSNYEDFVSLLDKLMSQNINVRFFGDDVSQYEEVSVSDGVIERRRKGSIALLEEWLGRRFRPDDDAPIVEMIETLREIRRLRQRPAHAITKNEYDLEYYKMQDALMERAYTAVRTLRLVMASHPACSVVEVPEWLFEGRIVTY